MTIQHFRKVWMRFKRQYYENLTEHYFDYKSVSDEYDQIHRKGKKLVLGVTAGRSGMKWLMLIFRAHKNAEGEARRNAIAESFYRYIKWNNLPIDTEGIIEITKSSILLDWKKAEISIVVSPYFSHDLPYLFRKLKPDYVVWGINDPQFTVTSFYNKGVYINKNIRENKNLVNGFQPALKDSWDFFFGRLVPRGAFYDGWSNLTRVGKISWYLNEVNKEIFNGLKRFPQNKIWVFRLEEADQNYEYYLKLARFFSLQPLIGKKKFFSIKKKAAFKEENISKKWSQKEQTEFLKYAKDYISIYKSLRSANPAFFLV